MESGIICRYVKTASACESAARELGLSDITVEDDGQNSVSYDPPFCYFEGGRLKFNSLGTNTGACTTGDQCICTGPVGKSKTEANVLMKFCNLVSFHGSYN